MNSEINYQKIRNGKLAEKQTKSICENDSNNLPDCIQLDFNQWHEIYLINYQESLIIKINDYNFMNGRTDLSSNNGFSFGVASFTGNKVYFTDIEFSSINFPQKAKNTVFGSIKTKSKQIFNAKFKQKTKNEDYFLGFSFKENENKLRFNEESIGNIKLACLKFQGSEESCTQAMIAYDELITNKKGQEIEEEEISRIVYKKCLDFEGNSPLGCSFAYKKALEVLYFFFYNLFIYKCILDP